MNQYDDIALPPFWTWARVEEERKKWGIGANMVPVATAPGCVAWGTINTAPRRCTNSNRGTFNHECGKPTGWIGVQPSGHRQAFCDRCQAEGDEARTVKTWERI